MPKDIDRVIEQIRSWRDDLINLSKGNRLLYFKHTQSSTLEIESPSCEDILKHLQSSRGQLKFYVRGEDGPDDRQETLEPSTPPPPKSDELVCLRPTKGAGGNLLPAGPGDVARVLRNLDRQATQDLLDRGIVSLYLGLGLLRWQDPKEIDPGRSALDAERPPEWVLSPLVLLPVSIVKDKTEAAFPFRLIRGEDDPVMNPALTLKLDADCDVALPGVDDYEELDLHALFAHVEASIGGKKGWSLERRTVLGRFSFHKEVMYRDLLENEAEIAEHAFVQALATSDEGAPPMERDGDWVSDEDLDRLVPSEDMVSILDADASQRKCIAAARGGHSFVMHGPPGTGKSQTIANMIAELMAAGRSVLFVSEKAAALDVVYTRLQDAQLGDYVLQLHSHKATRREVATELSRSLTAPSKVAKLPDPQLAERLRQRRQELNLYAQALNELRQPLGLSLHDAIGRVSQLIEVPQIPEAAPVDADLTRNRLRSILETAEAIGRVWGPVERGEAFLWRDLTDTDDSEGRKARARRDLSEIMRLSRELESEHEATVLALGVSMDVIPRLAETAELLARIALESNGCPVEWLSAPELGSVGEAISDLQCLIEGRRDAVLSIEQIVGEGWSAVSPENHVPFAASIQRLQAPPLPLEVSPALTGDHARRQARHFEEWARRLCAVVANVRELGDRLGVTGEDPDLACAKRIATLQLLVREKALPEPEWLDPLVVENVDSARMVLSAIYEQAEATRSELEAIFTEAILEEDLKSLCARFETVHQGLGKSFRGQYWADRKTLARCSRTGRFTPQVASRLRDALRWQELREKLRDAEQVHAGRLGAYFRGEHTDFREVDVALSAAKKALELVGRDLKRETLSRQIARGAQPRPEDIIAAQEVCAELEQWEQAQQQLFGQDRDSTQTSIASMADICASRSDELDRLAGFLEEWSSVASRELTIAEAVQAAEARVRIEELERRLEAESVRFQGEMHDAFQGAATDLDGCQQRLDWAVRLRDLLGRALSSDEARRILRFDTEPVALERIRLDWAKAIECFLEQFTEAYSTHLRARMFEDYRLQEAVLTDLLTTVDDITEWTYYAGARSTLEAEGLSTGLHFCEESVADGRMVASVVERWMLERWVDVVMKSDGKRVGSFRSTDRDALTAEFQKLDKELIRTSRAKVIRVCEERRPRPPIFGVAATIEREGAKKKRHMPIRDLIRKTEPVALALKPCFMMSPLSVSQFLDPKIKFDVVIFDEASQVRPHDAINAIYRGRQHVIAGDQQQLPPTSYFDVMGDDGEEYEEGQLEQFESILDTARGAGCVENLPLLWHYRSQHESLIAFSNKHFYDGRLITFPGATDHGEDIGLELFNVGGTYRRGAQRDNPTEARAVADRVLLHMREHPRLSIGVVAFSEAQESAIESEIERLREQHPELEGLFETDRLHGFFVKNLESVQGDERDIIIFSIGYARDENGKLYYNFGPINKQGGYRRLNVAISRARRRIEVVTSISAGDIKERGNEGVRLLAQYLDYAERGPAALALGGDETGGDAESPFEEEVLRVISSWGYEAVPQVGCAGYRLDIGVRHPDRPGDYALAVECDGAAYHSSKVARDRDRLRQQVLESLDWRIHRVWGPSWYRERAREEERLKSAIESAVSSGRRTFSEAKPLPSNVVEIDVIDSDWLPGSVDLDRLRGQLGEQYVVVDPGQPKYRVEMSDPNARPSLWKMIDEVVLFEGPVSEELVLQRCRVAFGCGHAGSRVRKNFEQAVRETKAVRRTDDGFLWYAEQALQKPRFPAEDCPEAIRPVTEVHPTELDLALVAVAESARRISSDELTSTAAALFGWRRRGADIKEALEASVRRLLKMGLVVEDDDCVCWAGEQESDDAKGA